MKDDLKEKIEEIVGGVFLHASKSPHVTIGLPEGHYTISEAVEKIMQIIKK